MTTELSASAATPEQPVTLLTAIGTALEAEHWTRTELCASPQNVSAAAWTYLDGTVELLLTSAPDEPPMAELTGHPVGHPTIAIWTLCITDPSRDQVLAAARAAVSVGRGELWQTAVRLHKAGWICHADDASPAAPYRLRSPDERRVIAHIAGSTDQPGCWMLEGRDLRADASDGTPATVITALATAAPGG